MKTCFLLNTILIQISTNQNPVLIEVSKINSAKKQLPFRFGTVTKHYKKLYVRNLTPHSNL